MIPELFLTCALALPAGFSGHTPAYTVMATFRFLLYTTHKEYSDDYKHRNPIVLLVDDGPTLVDRLRASHMVAWAMTPFSPMSRWQFMGDHYLSPIKDESIDIAYLDLPVRRWPDVEKMMRMVRNKGFLLLNMINTPQYDGWLRRYGWQKLPFVVNEHSIYRRSA